MPEPTVMDLKDAIVYLVDGTGTPVELELIMDDGNLTYTERVEREYKKNRGKLNTVRNGDEQPVEVSVQARFKKIVSQSGELISVKEFLRNEGAGSALISTDPDLCAPFAIDIVVKKSNNCTSVDDEIHTFSQFRYEEIGGDYQAGMLSITGKCNTPFVTGERTTLP